MRVLRRVRDFVKVYKQFFGRKERTFPVQTFPPIRPARADYRKVGNGREIPTLFALQGALFQAGEVLPELWGEDGGEGVNSVKREEALKVAKPILFNTEMIRAIQHGRKTVTRRVLKTKKYIPVDAKFGYTGFTPQRHISCRGSFQDENGDKRYGEGFIKLPYQKGDILYVRETWSLVYVSPKRYLYKTRCPEAEGLPVRWRPSIHMPKEAARIFLRVTSVRVERLQKIITGDYRTTLNIKGEGLWEPCLHCTHHNGDCKDFIADHTCRLANTFTDFWNSTVKKSDLDKYGWEANPWVWVIEFERLEVEI